MPVGLFNPDCKTGKGKTEIDLSKAFAYQLINIVSAMVFNQFDIWKTFDDNLNIMLKWLKETHYYQLSLEVECYFSTRSII